MVFIPTHPSRPQLKQGRGFGGSWHSALECLVAMLARANEVTTVGLWENE